MFKRVDCFLGSLFVLTAILLPVSKSFAAIENFTPYAYASVTHDSNLFRLSGDQEANAVLGDNSRDDTIGHLGVGFNSDLKLSRQHLLLDVEADRAIYDKYDDLDHTRVDGRATWAWELGNLWSGNLLYGYNRRMRSFNFNQTPEKDMRTEHIGSFSAGYQLHPDWRLLGSVGLSDVSYQEQEQLDRTSNSGRMEVQYQNTLNTQVGVRFVYSDYDLRDDNINGIIISNDYQETEVSGVFYWEGSDKSALEANLGYTTQSFDDLDERNYEGSIGRLTYHWNVTGKTTLHFSAWRETSSQDDEVFTYVLTKGASVTPVWSITPVITLRGELFYENDDYKGTNDIRVALGGQRRDDDLWKYGISAKWNPRRYASLTVGYKKGDRDSSIDSNDYDYRQVYVRAGARF